MSSTVSGESAVTKALQVPELMEAILRLLPAANIVTAKRVGKIWKRSVDIVPSLRRITFDDPGRPTSGWLLANGRDAKDALEWGDDPFFVGASYPPPGPFKLSNGFVQNAKLNELFLTHTPNDCTRGRFRTPLNRAFYGEQVEFRRITDVADDEKSYMKMLITQPACHAIRFKAGPPVDNETHNYEDDDDDEDITQVYPNGVTYGDILIALRGALEEAKAKGFQIVSFFIVGVLFATTEDEAKIAEDISYLE